MSFLHNCSATLPSSRHPRCAAMIKLWQYLARMGLLQMRLPHCAQIHSQRASGDVPRTSVNVSPTAGGVMLRTYGPVLLAESPSESARRTIESYPPPLAPGITRL